jgi:hypothetical protein
MSLHLQRQYAKNELMNMGQNGSRDKKKKKMMMMMKKEDVWEGNWDSRNLVIGAIHCLPMCL